MSRALNALRDVQKVLQEAMHRAREIISADRGTLFLLDHRTRELYAKMADGVSDIRISMKRGVAAWVATNNATALIKNAYDDGRFSPAVDNATGYRTRTILCMPIRARTHEVLGVAQMINKKGGVFGVEDVKTLEAFVAQTAVALENTRCGVMPPARLCGDCLE